MNKSELVNKISGKLDMPIDKVGRVIDEAINVVTDELAQGNTVQFVGFGTFSVTNRSEREGRDPRTGEKIFIEASRIAHFKTGKKLKAVLNT